MKTAISIPDEIFEAAERAAMKLGMSRSELYVNAVREYVDRYGREHLTEKLNEVYAGADRSDMDRVLGQMQSKSLPHEEW